MKIGKILVIIIPSEYNKNFYKITKLYFDKNIKKNINKISNIELILYQNNKFKYKNKILSILDYIENHINDYRACLILKDDVFISNVPIENLIHATDTITTNLENHNKLIGGFSCKKETDESILFLNINKIKNKSYINLCNKILLNKNLLTYKQILKYLIDDTLDIEKLSVNKIFYLREESIEGSEKIYKDFLIEIFKNNILFYKFSKDYFNNKRFSSETQHLNNCILYSLYKNYKDVKIEQLNRSQHSVYYIDILKKIYENYEKENTSIK